jgi:FO synthase
MTHDPEFDRTKLTSRLLDSESPESLLDEARALTIAGHGRRVTYSRNVFIPLTKLCRDVCHYCTFAVTPSQVNSPYLSPDEVLKIARRGKQAGCAEALFTLGDQPEQRYAVAREWLSNHGWASTLEYVGAMARLVLDETGLVPHLNPGLMTEQDYEALRPHSVSMGIMLESVSDRLCQRGGVHFGSPDKLPARRLASIEAAGKMRVPFTTGILIGVGETREERLDALFELRDIHDRFGHLQEIIIQNFRAKTGTKMASAAEPSLEDHLWTVVAARLIFGPEMTIQAPPNLRPNDLSALIQAGVNDWGGVSPVTTDHVNPEASWPQLDALREATHRADRILLERLAIAPRFANDPAQWLDKNVARHVLNRVDGFGLRHIGSWRAGAEGSLPLAATSPALHKSASIDQAICKAQRGEVFDEHEIVELFEANGEDEAIASAADVLRAEVVGDDVTYVINRNINYTNICLYKCGFCAFSKGSTRALRGPAYLLDSQEIARRAEEAVQRGATEVCLQGGIHPDYDGNTYLGIVDCVKEAAPDIHIHAFSPLEVTHGARTLGISLEKYLRKLRSAGLSTLPGTAAEILDDEVRRVICPDKVSAEEWLEVMRTAHGVGLRSTATIMFGHVESYRHWARHLLRIRALQKETGGFTEFVPLPFVHMESPIWRKGLARQGPSFRETILIHSIARIVIHGAIANIQASWVKLGPDGAVQALQSGANDLGGVLMDESITRAAGGTHGQQCSPEKMVEIAQRAGRKAAARTTLYTRPPSNYYNKNSTLAERA